mmetsp:Transcript_19367/g.48468  ORF Transcript_19367/g.48468 Transcript_19367/m.48468 type:complete len:224 (-) Transcript_19367:5117-5788(-)
MSSPPWKSGKASNALCLTDIKSRAFVSAIATGRICTSRGFTHSVSELSVPRSAVEEESVTRMRSPNIPSNRSGRGFSISSSSSSGTLRADADFLAGLTFGVCSATISRLPFRAFTFDEACSGPVSSFFFAAPDIHRDTAKNFPLVGIFDGGRGVNCALLGVAAASCLNARPPPCGAPSVSSFFAFASSSGKKAFLFAAVPSADSFDPVRVDAFDDDALLAELE